MAITEYISEELLRDSLEKAKKLNINDSKLLDTCDKLLAKKVKERELLERLKHDSVKGAVEYPLKNQNKETSVTPLEELLITAQANKPYDSKVFDCIC